MVITIISTGLTVFDNGHPISGGIENIVYNTAYRLLLKGINIYIIDSIRLLNKKESTLRKHYIINLKRTRFIELPLSIIGGKGRICAQLIDQSVFGFNVCNYLNEILSYISNNNEQIIFHLHDPIVAYMVLRCLDKHDIRIVYTIHNALYLNPERSLLFPLYMNIERNVVQVADKVLTTHYSLSSVIRKLFNVYNIDVLYNGVDTKFFTPDLRGKIDLIPDKHLAYFIEKYEKIFGYVGPLIPEKGVDILLRAFKHVSHPIDRVGLIVIGPFKGYGVKGFSRYALELLQYTRNHGLKNVYFTGEVRHDFLRYIYPNLDYLIQPFRFFEPLSLSAIESLSSGTPLIVPCRGDGGFIVENFNTGICYRNEGDLRTILMDAINYGGYEDLRKQSRIIAEKLFDWDIIIDKLLAVYGELL